MGSVYGHISFLSWREKEGGEQLPSGNAKQLFTLSTQDVLLWFFMSASHLHKPPYFIFLQSPSGLRFLGIFFAGRTVFS